MKKLTITVGISGSGKSTWAHHIFQQDPLNTRIINRDKLRELLYGYTEADVTDYYLRKDLNKLEKEVTKYEDTLIENFLNDDKHVIVDATHLKRDYLERFRYWNVPIKLEFFDVDLVTAIKRAENRNRKIGQAVIKKQANRYASLRKNLEKAPMNYRIKTIKLLPELPPAIIFDVDGTLAHKGKRSPYDMTQINKDKVDIPTRTIFKYLEDYADTSLKCENYKPELDPPTIIVCTGRSFDGYEGTQQWLHKHKMFPDKTFIRDPKDNRPDWQIKEEMWEWIARSYNIIGMFDDRQQVVRRARALGLKVFNVENHNF